MTGAHRVRDIAEQAGLSEATVDRVLHGRPGASARAVRAVEHAVAELDRQQTQLRLGARSLLLDVVVQAPARFSAAVRYAVESELDVGRQTAVRARFHARESADPEAAAGVLDGLATPGRAAHGVILKAPDHPVVAAAVDRLADRGVPVVSLVTDLRGSRRIAYVGPDNAAAGATAAYLMDLLLRGRAGAVLVTESRSTFAGERERTGAFASALGRLDPRREVVTVTDTDGLDETLGRRVSGTLRERPDVVAVYSVGGGNRATVAAFTGAGRACAAFIAHDLDRDNLELLRAGAVTLVLHHDLQADVRAGIRQVLRHYRLVPGAPTSVPATVEVVTPHNVPARLGPH